MRQGSPELRAHFHEVDQFQVVLAGLGKLGRADACRDTLHYADGFTTYGPIRTDPAVGLANFAVRRTPTHGLNYMPEEREKRARVRGVSEHFTCQVPDRVGLTLVEVARPDRGAIAFACRLTAGVGAVPPVLSQAREGYVVVLRGNLDGGQLTVR